MADKYLDNLGNPIREGAVYRPAYSKNEQENIVLDNLVICVNDKAIEFVNEYGRRFMSFGEGTLVPYCKSLFPVPVENIKSKIEKLRERASFLEKITQSEKPKNQMPSEQHPFNYGASSDSDNDAE